MGETGCSRRKRRRVRRPRGRCEDLDGGLAEAEGDRERVVPDGMAGRHARMHRVSKTMSGILVFVFRVLHAQVKIQAEWGGVGVTRSYTQTGHCLCLCCQEQMLWGAAWMQGNDRSWLGKKWRPLGQELFQGAEVVVSWKVRFLAEKRITPLAGLT